MSDYNDFEEDDFSLDDLEYEKFSVEQLAGRNSYHYTNGLQDPVQPASYALSELELSEDEEDEDEEGAAPSPIEDLPADCWVKRYVDDEDPSFCYLLYLVHDDENCVTEVGCLSEKNQSFGGGLGLLFPGVFLPGEKSYFVEDICEMPDKVLKDAKCLLLSPDFPLDFTFIGKRLPQQMIDEGGNGGDNTDYTFALQSAHRMAYTHMSIDTTEEGIIENLDYSSYQSSGNPYGDMFSRPILVGDRADEALDMLLYIFDLYTEEEYRELGLKS